MTDQSDSPRRQTAETDVARALDRRTRTARGRMALERLAVAFWPLAALAPLLIAAVLSGAFASASDGVRLAMFAAFAVAGGAAFIRGVARFRWPSWAEARARLDATTPGRPVASFDETLALGGEDAGSASLWAAHRARVAEAAAAARAPAADLRVGGRRDPWAMRFFAALALGGAILLGATRGDVRDAVAGVGLEAPQLSAQAELEVWATPPAYTGAPPAYLDTAAARRGRRIAVEGALLSIRVFNASAEPALTIEPAPAEPALVDEGGGAYTAEITLTQAQSVELVVGGEKLVDLDFRVLPDQPPSIAVTHPPSRARGGALTFGYTGADDYGIVATKATIRLDPDADRDWAPEPQEPIEIPLTSPVGAAPSTQLDVEGLEGAIGLLGGGLFGAPSIPLESDPDAETDAETGAETDAETALDDQRFEENFTQHPWAGLPVVLVITVQDGAGQEVRTEPIRFTMPMGLFGDPMARALLEERADLFWNQTDAPRVRRTLEAVTRFPQDYFDDTPAFLLTRSAISMLNYAIQDNLVAEKREAIADRLYRAAVRLEYGDLTNVAEQLAKAIERLREALDNNASDEEISELIDELREAIERYMSALNELARTNPELAEQLRQQLEQSGSMSMGRDRLEQLLQQLEGAAQDGARDQAEQMLSMLEQLLNSMRPGAPQQGQPGDGFGQQQQGQSGQSGDQQSQGEGQPGQGDLDQLGDMIGQQQGLAERSYDSFRRGPDGQPQGGREGDPQAGEGGREGDEQGGREAGRGDGPPDAETLRRRQEALRGALRDFRNRLDRAEGEYGEARREAGEAARESLDRADDAMRDAEQALRRGDPGEAADDQMRAVEALRDAAREMSERYAQERDGQFADEADPDDPFQGGGQGAVSRDYDVPGDLEGTTPRDILDELRRRSGERERPQQELDYFDRLLDFFR